MAGAAWLVRLQPALLLACCLLLYATGLLHEQAGTGSSGSSSSSSGSGRSVFLNRPTAALHSEGSGGTRAQRSASAAGAGAGAQDASNRWLQAEQGSGQGSSEHLLLRHPRRQVRLWQQRQDHQTTAVPSSEPIPPVLWQTYRTSALPTAAQQLVSSWQILNPELDLRMHNDSRASTFINRTFVDDLVEVYHNLPLGVMRADLFRYAILYARGGEWCDDKAWAGQHFRTPTFTHQRPGIWHNNLLTPSLPVCRLLSTAPPSLAFCTLPALRALAHSQLHTECPTCAKPPALRRVR